MAQAQYRHVRAAAMPAAVPPAASQDHAAGGHMALATQFAHQVTWLEQASDLMAQADVRGQTFAQQHPYVYQGAVVGVTLLLLFVLHRMYALRFLSKRDDR